MRLSARAMATLSLLFGLLCSWGLTMPEFLARFDSDPFSSPAWRGKCSTCHIDPSGSGPRNPFGRAFEGAGKTITPMLRAQFSDRFAYPQIVVDSTTRLHYSDPQRRVAVLERDNQFVPVSPNEPPAHQIAAQPTAAPAAGERPSARRQHLQLANRVLNFPALNPLPRGGVEVNISHRFTGPAFKGTAGDLWGLDGSANIAFGVDVGVTDQVRVGISRTRFDKTFELDTLVRAVSQSETFPLSLGFRAGLEGRNNFQDRFNGSLQVIAARSFSDWFQFYATPTLILGARHSQPPFRRRFAVGGRGDNHTLAIGLGGDLAIRPSVSLLGEWVPRVAGWKGVFEDRSTISFGIKKSTNRHAFVLTFSKSADITPTGYAVNSPEGTLGFKVGFNIYRRLH